MKCQSIAEIAVVEQSLISCLFECCTNLISVAFYNYTNFDLHCWWFWVLLSICWKNQANNIYIKIRPSLRNLRVWENKTVFTEQACGINIHTDTYRYALLFCTFGTYFPSIYETIQDVMTFWLEHVSNSILHTPRSRVLLVKLTVSQPVKKFPTFYGTRCFIPTFTHALHLSLSFSNISLILMHITDIWPFKTQTQMNTTQTHFKFTTSTTFKILIHSS
jgi:hypothetical protein